jgi:hypothetical protein
MYVHNFLPNKNTILRKYQTKMPCNSQEGLFNLYQDAVDRIAMRTNRRCNADVSYKLLRQG